MPIPSVSSSHFCFSKHYAAADQDTIALILEGCSWGDGALGCWFWVAGSELLEWLGPRLLGVMGPWVAGVDGPSGWWGWWYPGLLGWRGWGTWFRCLTLLSVGACLLGGSTALWGNGTTVSITLFCLARISFPCSCLLSWCALAWWGDGVLACWWWGPSPQ